MKNIIACLLAGAALLCAATTASAQTFGLSDIQYWVGTGTNQSAFVISWNDGITPDSLVFGYNWNTPATGGNPTVYDMMQAIVTADPLLQFTAVPTFTSPSNYAVYSAFYNLTGGAGPTVGMAGNIGGTESGFAPAGDHYEEGWFYNGFWGEMIAQGNPYDGGSWDFNDAAGVSVDTISNGSWDALSFGSAANDFNPPNPAFPTAFFVVPEPSGIRLTLFGGIALFVAWLVRRRRVALRAG